MNTTKAQVIARRNTLFLGLPAGILMFLAMRTIPTSTLGAHTKYSFLFVDITSWPDIFKIGFLPLDFVFAVGWTMIFFYLAFYGLSEDGQTQLLNERRGAAKYILGTIVACAAMGGAFSTGRNGWYIGLEAVLMSAIALVAALGIGALAFIIMSGIIG